MPVTPADIESEHHEALESLTREQRWALYRVQRAYQESHFNHRKIGENLEKIFEDEARRRNEAESLHQMDQPVDHEATAERATD
jgi:hypothetical protein